MLVTKKQTKKKLRTNYEHINNSYNHRLTSTCITQNLSGILRSETKVQ